MNIFSVYTCISSVLLKHARSSCTSPSPQLTLDRRGTCQKTNRWLSSWPCCRLPSSHCSRTDHRMGHHVRLHASYTRRMTSWMQSSIPMPNQTPAGMSGQGGQTRKCHHESSAPVASAGRCLPRDSVRAGECSCSSCWCIAHRSGRPLEHRSIAPEHTAADPTGLYGRS